MEENISIDLTHDQALVLAEWLWRMGDADQPPEFVDQAEQRALWDLECSLEEVLVEPFRHDYLELLAAARDRYRYAE